MLKVIESIKRYCYAHKDFVEANYAAAVAQRKIEEGPVFTKLPLQNTTDANECINQNLEMEMPVSTNANILGKIELLSVESGECGATVRWEAPPSYGNFLINGYNV